MFIEFFTVVLLFALITFSEPALLPNSMSFYFLIVRILLVTSVFCITKSEYFFELPCFNFNKDCKVSVCPHFFSLSLVCCLAVCFLLCHPLDGVSSTLCTSLLFATCFLEFLLRLPAGVLVLELYSDFYSEFLFLLTCWDCTRSSFISLFLFCSCYFSLVTSTVCNPLYAP